MPMVIPSASSATASSSVQRLSLMVGPPPPASAGSFPGGALLDEGVPVLVGHAGQVELEGEALLEAVRALDVDRVDAVERGLGRPDHRGALGGDRAGHLEGGLPQ